MNMTWNKLKYNYWPRFTWYATGEFAWDFVYNFWWVRIAKRQPLWEDAVECPKRFCRFCGKGKK